MIILEKAIKSPKITAGDIKKLEKVFKDLDNEASSLGLTLVEELKFSKKTIKRLKREINSKGVVVDMPQGNYTIQRTNPALQSYNALVKNYQTLIKQIVEMLPESYSDNLDNFDNDDL